LVAESSWLSRNLFVIPLPKPVFKFIGIETLGNISYGSSPTVSIYSVAGRVLSKLFSVANFGAVVA
jgi:hypothetical protein